MVITGHDHKQDAEVFGSTTYIIMDALKDGLSNAGYFQIKVKHGKLGMSLKILNIKRRSFKLRLAHKIPD